jgi:hypothetical protein
MGNIVDQAVKAPPLDGFAEVDLHPQIVEALKVLRAHQEEHQRVLASLDAQYLKPLEAAHDGDSEACQLMLAQIGAVRSLF